jgi:hypothetical protein
MRMTSIAFLAFAALASPGCISYVNRAPMPEYEHQIVLRENDFQIDKTNLRSSHECWFLFGVIPLGEPDTMSQCVTEVRAAAMMDGKPAQLVNVTKDDVLTNFLVVTRQTLTITADSVVYTK